MLYVQHWKETGMGLGKPHAPDEIEQYVNKITQYKV